MSRLICKPGIFCDRTFPHLKGIASSMVAMLFPLWVVAFRALDSKVLVMRSLKGNWCLLLTHAKCYCIRVVITGRRSDGIGNLRPPDCGETAVPRLDWRICCFGKSSSRAHEILPMGLHKDCHSHLHDGESDNAMTLTMLDR